MDSMLSGASVRQAARAEVRGGSAHGLVDSRGRRLSPPPPSHGVSPKAVSPRVSATAAGLGSRRYSDHAIDIGGTGVGGIASPQGGLGAVHRGAHRSSLRGSAGLAAAAGSSGHHQLEGLPPPGISPDRGLVGSGDVPRSAERRSTPRRRPGSGSKRPGSGSRRPPSGGGHRAPSPVQMQTPGRRRSRSNGDSSGAGVGAGGVTGIGGGMYARRHSPRDAGGVAGGGGRSAIEALRDQRRQEAEIEERNEHDVAAARRLERLQADFAATDLAMMNSAEAVSRTAGVHNPYSQKPRTAPMGGRRGRATQSPVRQAHGGVGASDSGSPAGTVHRNRIEPSPVRRPQAGQSSEWSPTRPNGHANRGAGGRGGVSDRARAVFAGDDLGGLNGSPEDAIPATPSPDSFREDMPVGTHQERSRLAVGGTGHKLSHDETPVGPGHGSSAPGVAGHMAGPTTFDESPVGGHMGPYTMPADFSGLEDAVPDTSSRIRGEDTPIGGRRGRVAMVQARPQTHAGTRSGLGSGRSGLRNLDPSPVGLRQPRTAAGKGTGLSGEHKPQRQPATPDLSAAGAAGRPGGGANPFGGRRSRPSSRSSAASSGGAAPGESAEEPRAGDGGVARSGANPFAGGRPGSGARARGAASKQGGSRPSSRAAEQRKRIYDEHLAAQRARSASGSRGHQSDSDGGSKPERSGSRDSRRKDVGSPTPNPFATGKATAPRAAQAQQTERGGGAAAPGGANPFAGQRSKVAAGGDAAPSGDKPGGSNPFAGGRAHRRPSTRGGTPASSGDSGGDAGGNPFAGGRGRSSSRASTAGSRSRAGSRASEGGGDANGRPLSRAAAERRAAYEEHQRAKAAAAAAGSDDNATPPASRDGKNGTAMVRNPSHPAMARIAAEEAAASAKLDALAAAEVQSPGPASGGGDSGRSMLSSYSSPSPGQRPARTRGDSRDGRDAARDMLGLEITEDDDGGDENVDDDDWGWVQGKELGRGPMGKVFKGMDEITGELFAVKALDERRLGGAMNTSVLDDLATNVMGLSRLSHPNLVRYQGSFRQPGHALYVFMEIVLGGSVHSLTKEFGALDESVIVVYTRQILAGLAHLHSHGFTHGGLRSSNVFIDTEGGVRLADFGLAEEGSLEMRMQLDSNMLKGTGAQLPFSSPARVRGEGLTHAEDIWSLGCVIVQMATGDVPFPHYKSGAKVMSMLKDIGSGVSPDVPPALSERGKDFVRRCFEPDAAKRWTAAQLQRHDFVTHAAPLPGSVDANPATTITPAMAEKARKEAAEAAAADVSPYRARPLSPGGASSGDSSGSTCTDDGEAGLAHEEQALEQQLRAVTGGKHARYDSRVKMLATVGDLPEDAAHNILAAAGAQFLDDSLKLSDSSEDEADAASAAARSPA